MRNAITLLTLLISVPLLFNFTPKGSLSIRMQPSFQLKDVHKYLLSADKELGDRKPLLETLNINIIYEDGVSSLDSSNVKIGTTHDTELLSEYFTEVSKVFPKKIKWHIVKQPSNTFKNVHAFNTDSQAVALTFADIDTIKMCPISMDGAKGKTIKYFTAVKINPSVKERLNSPSYTLSFFTNNAEYTGSVNNEFDQFEPWISLGEIAGEDMKLFKSLFKKRIIFYTGEEGRDY